MSGWAAGDLALRVGKSAKPQQFGVQRGHSKPRIGGVYTVEAVIIHPWLGDVGLVIAGHHSAHPFGPAWDARSFRKIEPHEPDAEDAESIRLLSGEPQHEDATPTAGIPDTTQDGRA